MTSPEVIEVEAPGGPATRSALLLHGILGSGANWRSFVRRLLAHPAARGWRFVLPDLRGHGERPADGLEPTLAACAQDCAALEAASGKGFDWILGHSFGGKVACTFAARHALAPRALWLLDTPPMPAPLVDRGGDSVVRVLASLEAFAAQADPDIPTELPAAQARPRVVRRLEADGLPASVAAWLGTSVRATPDGGWGWRFDLATVRALLEDFAGRDCLPWLAFEGDPTLRRVLVRGAESDRFPPEALAALGDPSRAGWLETVVLPQAGHWLHVDNPEGLLGLMVRALEEGPWP